MKSNWIYATLLTISALYGNESEAQSSLNAIESEVNTEFLEPCSDTTELKVESVCRRFGYVSLGVGPLPLPIPVFAGGYRMQNRHHGSDISLQVSTIGIVTQVSGNILYHYYRKPSYESQVYFGVGITPSVLFIDYGDTRAYISPKFVLGKEYMNKKNRLRFMQVDATIPNFRLNDGGHIKGDSYDPFAYPLVEVRYGLGF